MSDRPPAAETLSQFKRHSAEMLDRLKATGQPVVLTVRGKEEIVVQDAAAYRRLAAWAEKAEMFEFLNRSIADVDAGRTRPAKEFLESLGSGQ